MVRRPALAALGCALTVPLLTLTALSLGPSAVAAGPAEPSARASSPVAAPSSRDVVSSPEPGWQVVSLGGGRYQVSWTSATRLPITSDRPSIRSDESRNHLSVGVSTVAAGRTVVATVLASERPAAQDFDVLLSGRRLDARQDSQEPTRAAGRPSGIPAGGAGAGAALSRNLAVDPGTPGPYATVSSDYHLPDVYLSDLRAPVEMVGHVVEPALDAQTGPRPLVLLLHGRHDWCYDPTRHTIDYAWPCVAPFVDVPSQLGYTYLQQLLASQGFATVSIRANGINAQDDVLPDAGAGDRAQLIRRHLDYWTTIAADHRVDLQQVVLVGHSRGGEGANRASIEIPLSAPYRVVGQVLIAPTDFGGQSAPYIPTVTLLGYCDGDVSDLEGQRYVDAGRDLVDDDTSLKSSVLVLGANHNYFNSEWTPRDSAAPSSDDWFGPARGTCGRKSPTRLSAPQQRAVGATYVAGAVQLFTGRQNTLAMFDGSPVTLPSIGTATVYSAALGAGRTLRRPDLDTTLSLPTGANTDFCVGVAQAGFDRYDACSRTAGDATTPHWGFAGDGLPTRRWFQMAWTGTGQAGGQHFDEPLDLTGDLLAMRVAADPTREDPAFDVRITDSGGAVATLTPEGGGRLVPLPHGSGGATKIWAQEVRVDPSSTDLDLTSITQVELVSTSAAGRVWVADVASVPIDSPLPAVPLERLPTISFGALRLQEGDSSGNHTGHVPFAITGDLTSPARVSVTTVGPARGTTRRLVVDLAPGQRTGSIPVAYSSDRRDDLSPTRTVVSAWANRGIMTDDYLGALVVDDDDETPPIGISSVRTVVREGDEAKWVVRIGSGVDYDQFVEVQVLPSPGPLRGGDVPEGWLRNHASDIDPGRTLAQLYAIWYVPLRAGQTYTLITVPIAHDHTVERRESLRLNFKIGPIERTSTVFVAPSK